MGGVDLSDALIGYYNVLHKTRKWYRSFFYHFVDIAIVNAFILHKELASAKGERVMTHKAFREALVMELRAAGKPHTVRQQLSAAEQIQDGLGAAGKSSEDDSQVVTHMPKYFADDGSKGRRRCGHCSMKTPVYCETCDVALCLLPGRDCYNAWHDENNL